MVAKKVIPQLCPSCSAGMAITQLSCTACGTAVVGHFELGPFLKLSPASLRFLETFIRNRGNVKEMERESGQSYWAIRRQLDEVIAEMGFDIETDPESSPHQRLEILKQLRNGELGVAEAAALLTQLGSPAP